jgi:CrcB protein
MLEYLVVALGGAIGATLRFLAGKGATHLNIGEPFGTLFANFTGSFLLGLLLFSTERSGYLGEKWKLFIAVGILGAYTTMSAFSFESIKMLEERGFWIFLLYVVGTLLLVLCAVILGKGGSYLIVR